MSLWNDDDILVKKRGARIHMPPPIPDIDWQKPDSPPNLSAATTIAFDCETKDLTLDSEGPGWARNKAHIVGVSVAALDALGNRGSWYFPLRHEIEPHDNLDPLHVLPWLDTVLNTPNVRKVGANITYDIGNLACEGVRVSGPLDDVQFAEALIDSEALVALDILGHKYTGKGKETDLLKEWCRQAYPFTKPTKWRSDIYRTPPRLTAFYAISDADLPIDIMEIQKPLLDTESLNTVYRTECDLIPLMVAMRLRGVPVDVDVASKLVDEIEIETRSLYAQIYKEYGYNIVSTANRQLASLFDHVGIGYSRTATGEPSFRKEWLAGIEHPIADIINNIREREKIVSTFLRGYIINGSVNGRLYPQFHQLKNDESGTVVGRFSSSDPNLQNIPARTKLGKKVREAFVKETGHYKWVKLDQSQVHYRILAHNAVGPGAEELRQRYINDPSTDYHRDVQESVAPYLGWNMDDDELNDFRRRPIKNVNFGLLYGQSIKSLMYKTASYFGEGFTQEQAQAFFDAYFKGAPYIKPTMRNIGAEVQMNGYVTTLLGRRIRFNLYEPKRRERGDYFDPLPLHAAIREWGSGNIKRAYEYRGVNYKFQGSEPDIIKKGMLDCYLSGVFDVTGVPLITVHDEINWSLPDNSKLMRDALDFIKYTMTNCIQLRVPLKVDEEAGEAWGTVKKIRG